jgi:hypothetical protein
MAIASCSWTPEESQVESCEHHDNANIRHQPFPESVSEEREIYTDCDGCHGHRVKHASYPSIHFPTQKAFIFSSLQRIQETKSGGFYHVA